MVRLLALLVSVFGILTLQNAQAADLGGNCCADLEERIAELEATTARKGNRKVSLEIYGQVNEAILFWDDGGERTHTPSPTTTAAPVRLPRQGQDQRRLGGGLPLEVGMRSINSKRFTQDDPRAAADSGLDMRDSHWYLKSKTFGAVYIGLSTLRRTGSPSQSHADPD